MPCDTATLDGSSTRTHTHAHAHMAQQPISPDGADGISCGSHPIPTLDMWRNRVMDFPYLARVARRVLAIPATPAQSGRMFSTAGLTVNKRRGSLDPENVELLFFSLRCNWEAAEECQR